MSDLCVLQTAREDLYKAKDDLKKLSQKKHFAT